MTYNPSDPLESLDVETGLLQDTDAIRVFGASVARAAQAFFGLPPANMVFDMPSVIDMAISLVSAESMLTFVSQADYHRKLGTLLNADPQYIEAFIRQFGLSETLPMTHPQAPPDPVVQHGVTLQGLLKRYQEDHPVEHVVLPDDIEAFLKSLGREGYSPEGE